jgi:hypothetical protein
MTAKGTGLGRGARLDTPLRVHKAWVEKMLIHSLRLSPRWKIRVTRDEEPFQVELTLVASRRKKLCSKRHSKDQPQRVLCKPYGYTAPVQWKHDLFKHACALVVRLPKRCCPVCGTTYRDDPPWGLKGPKRARRVTLALVKRVAQFMGTREQIAAELGIGIATVYRILAAVSEDRERLSAELARLPSGPPQPRKPSLRRTRP